MILFNVLKNLFKYITSKMLNIYDAVISLKKYDSFILVYHRVTNDKQAANLRNNSIYNVSPDVFEEHLVYLKSHYEIVHLDYLIDEIRNGRSVKGKIAITFDDGFRDSYESAYPILKKYNVPAVIYLMGNAFETNPLIIWWIAIEEVINSAYKKKLSFHYDDFSINISINSLSNKIDAVKKLSSIFMSIPVDKHVSLLNTIIASLGQDIVPDHRSLVLSKEMIVEMYSSGLVYFGGHTQSHADLSLIDNAMLYREIVEQKQALESILNIPIDSFSYPYGMPRFISENAVDVVKLAGYKYAVTGVTGQLSRNSEDYFMLPRITTTGCKSVQDLKVRISYAYNKIRSNFVRL